MPLQLSSELQTVLQSGQINPAILAQLSFANGAIISVHTGIGNLVWNGNTYLGCGDFVSISTMEETSTVEAKNMTLTMSGIPSTLVNDTAYDSQLLKTCNIYLACKYSNGVVISDPILAFKGMLDAPVLTFDGQSATVAINVESILVDLNRPCYRRFDNDDQQYDLPNQLARLGLPSYTVDTGFQFVPDVQEKIEFWGTTPASTNNE